MGLQQCYFAFFAILGAYGQSFEINKTGCLVTKGCISFPTSCHSSRDCDYLVTFIPSKENVAFEMSARNEYIGFGINDQQAMGGTDSILRSKTATGNKTVLVGHYNLHNHHSPSITKPTPPGLTNMTGVYENGIIMCRFRRTIKASPPMKFNLNDKNYLIYARGKTSESGGLEYHTWRSYSSNRQKLTSDGPIMEATPVMIAIHAGLMFLAWVGFASIGMFTARNMKLVFGGKLYCGMHLWFQIHRTCMTFATLIAISGVAVIFVFKGGLSVETAGWHAIIGIIVVSLATIQPIIAFFRPSKESKSRNIFNWTHRCFAVVIFILAMTNCFLGLRLIDLPMTTHLGFYIILGFVISYLSILLLYELFTMCVNTKDRTTGLLSEDVNNSSESIGKSSENNVYSEGSNFTPLPMYLFVVLISVAACAAFITIIVLSVRKWEQT